MAFFSFSLVAISSGSELPPAPDAGDVKVHTLPNGLTVLIAEDHSAPVASVQAWCATGSIHEGKWLGAGLSHILEHMLFKGTEKRKAGEIARAIQDQGGYINAYTSFDRTVYWIDVPSSGVSEALDILSDAMMNSTLPEEEYVKEQEVIRREFAMGFDDPNRQGIHLLLRTMFPQSPYGIPIIGHLDVYNRLTRDDVMEYYRERYVPNNLTFVVVGDVDSAAILKQLEEFFADVPRGRLAPVLVPEEPAQIGRREASEEFATELSRLYLAWRVPGLDDPDAPALEILADILGSGRSSILNRDLRERKRLVHRIGAGVYSMQTEAMLYVSAVCDPDKREDAEKEILAAISAVKEHGVDEAQLEKARRSMLAGLLDNLTTARGRASSIGGDWALTRNLNFGKDFLNAVRNVSKEDVRRVAEKYLTNDGLTVASLNPKSDEVPPLETKDSEIIASGHTKKFELPNGFRLLVREDPRLPLVTINACFRGGILAETAENNGITKLLSQTLLKGTKNRTAEDIANELESAGGSISSDAGNNTYSVSVDVLKPDLKLGLDVLSDILLNPTFPASEVELEKQSQIAAIKAEEDQITSVARNLMRQKLFGEHPYSLRSYGTAESVGTLTSESLDTFHRTHTTARNGVLAVFGDVNAEEVLALVKEKFGTLPSGDLALQNPPIPGILASEIVSQAAMDKQQAVVMVGFRGTNVTSEDRAALEILSSASSDLGSRFFDRIREQMGLAYFVGASQMTGLAPGLFVFYVGTDPAKVKEVTAALREEIQKLAQEGLTEEELERAKKKILGTEAIRNQSNSAFAMTSAVNEIVGLGYDHSRKREEEIRSITLEKVREVAGKYFRDAQPVQVTIGPT